jgi:AAA15 family ATPase/GTPase
MSAISDLIDRDKIENAADEAMKSANQSRSRREIAFCREDCGLCEEEFLQLIDILRQFDDSIEDICYTKADDGSFMESIITKDGINMPFSVYGDGIKKILYILNKLFDATDSVLLIDEIETGLHKKYYDLLFPVIFALAKRLNVQLFIATHSIEAIDAILRYGNYEENTGEDFIRVITLKKIKSDNEISNIVARNVTGKYVYENRKVFEFEVRL